MPGVQGDVFETGIYEDYRIKTGKSGYIRRRRIRAFAVCVLYSVTDEIHREFFVDGRAFEFIDLAKDWSGSLIGVLSGGRINKIVIHIKQRCIVARTK